MLSSRQVTMEIIVKVIKFLSEIGVPVIPGPLEGDCFLPGIQIMNGEMHIDQAQLLYPGDILHEAGHIAIVPPAERYTLNDKSIGQRPMRDAEEMMAIAWSYAAAVHLDIDPFIVFHDQGYKGGGAYIAESFNKGQYFGVPMLQWTGMALEKPDPSDPSKPVYPLMQKWMRD